MLGIPFHTTWSCWLFLVLQDYTHFFSLKVLPLSLLAHHNPRSDALPSPISHLILLGKPQVVIRNRSWEDPQRSPRRRVNVESEAQRGRNKEGGRAGPQQPALSLRETQPRLFSNRGLFWLQETLSAVPDHWVPVLPGRQARPRPGFLSRCS